MPPEVFTDEAPARARYLALSDNWNCCLFQSDEAAELQRRKAEAFNWLVQNWTTDYYLQNKGWALYAPENDNTPISIGATLLEAIENARAKEQA